MEERYEKLRIHSFDYDFKEKNKQSLDSMPDLNQQ